MKTFYTIVLISTLMQAHSQVVNNLTISPANPTSNDVISVISDFTYFGNCSFGMVYDYSYLNGSTIYILPTYCGYGDTTMCNSIDTFEVGPYPAGNYNLVIEYHQGSICPISGFDATLLQVDTTIVIDVATSIEHPSKSNISIFPNPSSGYLIIEFTDTVTEGYVEVYNVMGEKDSKRQHSISIKKGTST